MQSKETELFMSRCMVNGQIRVIKPTIGESYKIPGVDKEIKFTEKILDEIKNSDKVKVRMVDEKTAIIQGVIVSENN